MNNTSVPGILIVSHGSRRAEATQGFVSLVQRIARRVDQPNVLPAFFSLARPNLPDQISELASRGVRRILLLPYFLYTGRHVTNDIPEILAECRVQYPELAIELLPALENDPAVEDVVVERLLPFTQPQLTAVHEGTAIQRLSFELIEHQLLDWQAADPGARQIVRRVVHATADMSFARSLRIHPQAVARGKAALAAGKPLICDVKMLQAGITKVPNELLCAIDQPGAAVWAETNRCTRSAAGMELLASRWEGAIVAVGNAPTALRKLLEIVGRGGPRPALVVGLPVGFVDALEAKLALLASDLCYISNASPRGGSSVAAAAVNALALIEEQE